MHGEPPVYNDKVIPRHGFRVYIYGIDGTKKLVESWDSFQAYMATGLWFATKKEAIAAHDKVIEHEVVEAEITEVIESRAKKPKRKEIKLTAKDDE